MMIRESKKRIAQTPRYYKKTNSIESIKYTRTWRKNHTQNIPLLPIKWKESPNVFENKKWNRLAHEKRFYEGVIINHAKLRPKCY